MDRLLDSKKNKGVIIISAFILLLAAILIYKSINTRKSYKEQTVMAQEYLDAGSYEDAVTAYENAISMKYGDKELLSIGLAEAYAGTHNYDKALEVLRGRYQVSGTTEIKEKIEKITAQKSDYNFYQVMSYGDTYFSNGEFSKAIAEYEKAKLIKSKEDVSYEKIAKSHMAMERYDLAKEEILEGLALTESENLEKLLTNVEAELKVIQYKDLLNKTSEYIYQENYEEAISHFNEAIWLMPDVDTAYNQMAEFYILIEDFDTAKYLIQNYLRSHKSDASEEILDKANKLIEQKEKQEEILNELYTAISVVDTETIINVIKEPIFIDEIAKAAPLYYNPSGDMTISYGYGMFILDRNNIYVGGFKDKLKEGIGVQFIYLEDEKEEGYYYYQGEWNHDIPNGMGKTCEEIYIKNKALRRTTVTSGLFTYGLESGGMQKIFRENGQEKGRVNYTVEEGKPRTFMDSSGNPIQAGEQGHYVIGEIYLNGELTGEYYSVKNGTIFKVKYIG